LNRGRPAGLGRDPCAASGSGAETGERDVLPF